MKKILLIVIILFLFTVGCGKDIDTPTKRVESFLKEYQDNTSNVRNRLNNSVKKEKLNKKQKEKYISLLEKQYQNLSYKITNEVIIENDAVVDIEIEVLNYNYSIVNSKKYYESHKDEIKDYNDYMLNNLEKTTDKIKYKLSLNLTNYDGTWELDEIDNDTIKKLHGLY